MILEVISTGKRIKSRSLKLHNSNFLTTDWLGCVRFYRTRDAEPLPSVRVLRFDSFELDVHAGELRKRGLKLRVRGQPLKVLAALLVRAGELVTRDELRTEIWQADTFVDFDHSLHNAIARLREVLGDSAEKPRYIETIPRRGYRLIGRVDTNKSEDSLAHKIANTRIDVSSIRAIAVLPLEDLSGIAGHEYVSDGMTEALINSLAKIKALRVISRTSAMQYKRTHKSLPEIARELNVDAAVEGSVLRSGERVRITVRLIHSTSDQHLWAEPTNAIFWIFCPCRPKSRGGSPMRSVSFSRQRRTNVCGPAGR